MQADKWFEDFTEGTRFETSGLTITESMIIDFAWQWDPQPFHIDVRAAEEGPYAGLIGSGFQTLLIAFRLVFQERLINPASMGSPGIDELRWLRPVRPGDTLKVQGFVTETRASGSKPDRGYVRIRYEVLNQREEAVMTYIVNHIFQRRPES
jgi:acyl dehydratase